MPCNLCEKFLIRVCKIKKDARKNWKHKKRITECFFHTWPKNYMISSKKSASDWILYVVFKYEYTFT